MKEIKEFYYDFMQELDSNVVANGEHKRLLFTEEILKILIDSEFIQDFNLCFYDGKYKKKNISMDAYSLDEIELDGTIYIIVSAFFDEPEIQNINSSDVKNSIQKAINIFEESYLGNLYDCLEPSTPVADFSKSIEKNESIKKLNIIYLSNGLLGSRFKDKEYLNINNIIVESMVFDISRIKELKESTEKQDLDIDITEFIKDGLPALRASIGNADYASYLCVVPGNLLASIYEKFGSRILEGNIRAFLSTSGAVNKGIKRTIMQTPSKFFAFNNGITATASSVEAVEGSKSYRIRSIKNLQIVNGGQTTASLFNAKIKEKANLDEIFVQMKLSIVEDINNDEMIPLIAKYANTQNKVSDADLFSNHAFHRKVEELSRKVWASPSAGHSHPTHWFYERARAQYQTEYLKLNNQQKKEYSTKYPKSQIITKTDLAKYENTWNMNPHLVSLGAQKNFIKYADYVKSRYENLNDINERWFQQLVCKTIIFKETEKLVQKADWYQNGYRANIVTYGISLFVKLIEKKFPDHVLDFDRIWKNQKNNEFVSTQILICCELAYKTIKNTATYITNLSEWAKKEECWKKVTQNIPEPIEQLKHFLKTKDEEEYQTKEAKIQEKEDQKIQNIIEVEKLRQANYWQQILKYYLNEIQITPLEHEYLKKISFNPHVQLTSSQAQSLLKIKEKMQEKDFYYDLTKKTFSRG